MMFINSSKNLGDNRSIEQPNGARTIFPICLAEAAYRKDNQMPADVVTSEISLSYQDNTSREIIKTIKKQNVKQMKNDLFDIALSTFQLYLSHLNLDV